MNVSSAFVSRAFVVMLSLAAIGCGQAYRQADLGGQGADDNKTSANLALSKAQVASQKVSGAIAESRTAIEGISDPSGNIAMNLFGSIWSSVIGRSEPVVIDVTGRGINVTSRGLLSPLVDRLQNVFNQVFARVDVVNSNINAARLELAIAASQLDANDPAQAILIAQINAQMKSLDVMEHAFKTQLLKLADKVDQAKGQLSKLVTFGTSFIPVPGLNILAGMLVDTFLLSDVNNLLDAVKLKLLLT